MNKLKYKLYQFMQGRYGIDQLGRFLVFSTIILYIVNLIFFRNTIINTLGLVLSMYCIYRIYSRKIYARQSENQKFMQLFHAPLQRQATLLEKQKNDPNNRYYRCKKCRQLVRVPRGRGKITITCPKCQNKFSKRT